MVVLRKDFDRRKRRLDLKVVKIEIKSGQSNSRNKKDKRCFNALSNNSAG